MGLKGPLAIVTPTEWTQRTSLTFSSRSASTRQIDLAYAHWYENARSRDRAAKLLAALEAYLLEKGGHWEKVERDNVSGGLMKYIHGLVLEFAGQERKPVAMTRLQNFDIPHSRYGVLYLLGNIDISMDYLQVGLEGAGAVGGAIGSGFATNLNHLDNVKQATKNVNMGALGLMSAQSIVTGSSTLLGVAPKLGQAAYGALSEGQYQISGREYVGIKPAARPLPGFPCTLLAFNAIKEDPVLFLNPYVLPATLVVGTATVVIEALNNLKRLITNAIEDLYEWIRKKLGGLSDAKWAAGGALVKGIIKIVVAKCLEAAAPLIGAAMDIGSGILKTIRAAKDRIGASLERRHIVITPGHPELIANSIESEMTKGILNGIWALLKGVAQVALQSFLPGAGNLVGAIVTGIEWMVKFIYRVAEQLRIGKFLTKARDFYAEERLLANASTVSRGHGGSGVSHVEPNMDPSKGGIIHDLAKFKTFYEEGCNASPLIPMLTLNSGICGSLMTLIKLFDDSSQHNQSDQKTFDVGDAYFTRLKRYGSDYLKSSGFKFTAQEAVVRGLLTHAVNDHSKVLSTADKLLAFGAS